MGARDTKPHILQTLPSKNPPRLWMLFGRCQGNRTRRMRHLGKKSLKVQYVKSLWGATFISDCPRDYKVDDKEDKERESNHNSFENYEIDFLHLFPAFLSPCSYLRGLGTPHLSLLSVQLKYIASGQVLHFPKANSGCEFIGNAGGNISLYHCVNRRFSREKSRPIPYTVFRRICATGEQFRGWGLWGPLWIHSRNLKFLGLRFSQHTSFQHSYLSSNWLRTDGKICFSRWPTLSGQPDKEVLVGRIYDVSNSSSIL